MVERTEGQGVPVARWSPFSELDWFEPRMRSLFGDVLGEGRRDAPGFAPAVDVTENDDEFVITAELPGARKDDMTVEFHDGVLTLRGEKRSEREEEKEHARYVERRFGSCSRSFTLPANADGERLEASFRDGVLTLRVPKREEAKPRVIRIPGG